MRALLFMEAAVLVSLLCHCILALHPLRTDPVVQAAKKPRVFVLAVTAADVGAATTVGLGTYISDAISFLIAAADAPTDEVVIQLTSPGGSVTDYGLAAGQYYSLYVAL